MEWSDIKLYPPPRHDTLSRFDGANMFYIYTFIVEFCQCFELYRWYCFTKVLFGEMIFEWLSVVSRELYVSKNVLSLIGSIF